MIGRFGMVWATFGGLSLLAALVGCGDSDGPVDPDDNREPTIDSLSAVPDTVFEAETVSFSVYASDPDGDLLTYLCQATGGQIAASGTQVTWTAPNTPGDVVLLVSVIDGRDGVDSRAITIVVLDRPTGIRGTAALENPVGEDDLAGARLALYLTEAAWANNNPWYSETIPAGSALVYNFTITPLPPGRYYLDVWKDLNANGERDAADLVGFFGTGDLADPELAPIDVGENEITNLPGTIYAS